MSTRALVLAGEIEPEPNPECDICKFVSKLETAVPRSLNTEQDREPAIELRRVKSAVPVGRRIGK